MVLGNPLRSRHAALGRASLAVGLTALMGCNVYGDELLARPFDGGDPQSDAPNASADAAISDAPPSSDAAPDIAGDGTAKDAAIDVSPETPNDVSAPDAAPDAVGEPRGDAAIIPDVADARLDAHSEARDAVAMTPDAEDAGPRDASGPSEADSSDERNAPPDVIADADADAGTAPPTFRVVRVGDGAMPLSSASTAVFVEERTWDGNVVSTPLSLSTGDSGANTPLTLSGIATAEGALSLSLDGRYLTLAGYATPPGRADIATSTDVERVVARIDRASTIDTTRLLGGVFSGSNARSAVSVDGASFWVGGSSGGVWYVSLGGAERTQIVTTPSNIRLVALFGDQLYGSSGVSGMSTVFSVGSGRPTSGAQDVAALTGLPRSGTSPYAFALFDRDPAVTGFDTLYLADDRDPESDGSGGGIQKWTFDGATWTRRATLTAVGAGRASFRGVAGVATSAGVALVASTSEMGTNRLVVFIDDGSGEATGKVIATAPTHTIFRGVALTPHL